MESILGLSLALSGPLNLLAIKVWETPEYEFPQPEAEFPTGDIYEI